MVPPSPDRLRRGLLFAPLVFVAHVLEESSGFVLWFNAHVTRGITADLFWAVNATALLITVLVTLLFWTTRSAAGVVLMVAWLSFLMLTNAGFHVTGAIVDRGYVPGLVTAILLYLPYCGWGSGASGAPAADARSVRVALGSVDDRQRFGLPQPEEARLPAQSLLGDRMVLTATLSPA